MARKTVAYLRTWSQPSANAVQRDLIAKYCRDRCIECERIYEDRFTAKKYKWIPLEQEDSGYVYDPNFPEWSQLLRVVCDDLVDTILVDTPLRLYRNAQMRDIFDHACSMHGTEIVAVGSHEVNSSAIAVAVYHYTDVSDVKPRVVLTDIDSLYEAVHDHKDREVSGLYLDLTLKKSEQANLVRLLEDTEQNDIILLKSFYHLNTCMVSFWNMVRRLERKGIKVVGAEEGMLSVDSEELVRNQLRVAIYDRSRSEAEEASKNLRLEKLNVFVKCRTEWKIVEIFSDRYNDKTCAEKGKLLERKGDYDIVLMDSFAMINPRTNHFCKFRDKLGVPVFSLKEGGVNWNGKI